MRGRKCRLVRAETSHSRRKAQALQKAQGAFFFLTKEQMNGRQEYHGAGYTMEEAGKNLELVLRCACDGDLRVERRDIAGVEPPKDGYARYLKHYQFVVFNLLNPSVIVPVTFKYNKRNGLHFACVSL